MDSYGDGNVYRGQVLKDSEIKTIEINKYNTDVERLVEAARKVKPLLEEHFWEELIELEEALEPFKGVK